MKTLLYQKLVYSQIRHTSGVGIGPFKVLLHLRASSQESAQQMFVPDSMIPIGFKKNQFRLKFHHHGMH